MAGLASSLKVPSEEVPARVANLVDRLKAAERNSNAPGWRPRGPPRSMRPRGRSAGNVRLVAQRMSAGRPPPICVLWSATSAANWQRPGGGRVDRGR